MKKAFTKILLLTMCCFSAFSVYAQNITVKGRITDAEDKSPLPGVTISLSGRAGGAQTDVNGNYVLSAPANATLIFSFIGYTTQQKTVNNATTINVELMSSSKQLDQVLVVGYGTQRKIDVTGAVVSIKGEEISKQASTNPIGALQGKVAGVSITNDGTPGASPQITIRGTGTIYGNTGVLYVVDGVWYDNINFLNPADVASISILKDASSQSIYGIRAANGVVLVTTVRGKKGNASINYNGYIGVQKVTNAVKMTNASEYATGINELYSLIGSTPPFTSTDLGKGTDWFDRVLRTAAVNNHQISLNGATEKSSYNISLGYLDQDGIVKTNNYKRYTVRLANDFQVLKALKVGYNVTGATTVSSDIPTSIFHGIYAASPALPVFNADGSYGDPAKLKLPDGKVINLGNGSNQNPQAMLDFNNRKTTTYKVTGNMFAELSFAKHFTFKTSFGGDFGQAESGAYTPRYTATTSQFATTSKLQLSRTETRNWIIENTLTYDNMWGNHSLKILAGQTAQRYKSYTTNASAQNVPNTTEGDLYLSLGDAATRQISDAGSLTTATSYFGRVNYGFKDRYLLNASLRADAASQFFGGSNLWGYFPSVGAGWVITNEDFMKDQHVFSNLKLRGSWGKVGNAGVPINPTTLQVSQNGARIAFFNGLPYTGASVASVVPPSIFWERSVGTDIAVEMGFLNNRLNIEADYYNRTTEQAIFDIPVFGNLGTVTSKLIGNQADFRNRGFEMVASWTDKLDGGFAYSISGNLGYNTNKVLNVTSGNNPIYAGSSGLTSGAKATRTVNNGPIGSFFGYQVAGIFQTNAEASASGQSGATAGDFKYVDQNLDGVIDAKDGVVLGNPNPKFNYGLNTNFSYKNFDLSLDIQGVAGVDVYNANLGSRLGNENFTKEFYDQRWNGAGSTNTYPSTKLGGGTNYLPNSFYVESGAYIRLRNVQLGYTLPSALLSRWKVQKLRFFANAQNAINIFGYRGFSPEVGGTPTNAGLDYNVYPLSATYNLGVNLTF